METLTVTELNRRARRALEQALPLLWVTGEISNLVRAASGHVYFTLKDEQAQARCVMFRSRANLVPWQLGNGQQVEVLALASIYEARGDFQLNVESMRRGGLGKLFESFTRLREKLEAEGLFAAERKRTLPSFPAAIGIVSSLQAAALRDVIAACRRRAPHLPLIIYPTPVQGEGSAVQIVDAINAAGAGGLCDTIIVARGGGSIEDLWSFNDEAVARAIAACPIPVVSGVGHETDVTIADFVADHRAATPTAAAELVTAGWFSAAGEVDVLRDQLQRRMQQRLNSRMQEIDLLTRRLLHPRQQLAKSAIYIDQMRMRLTAGMNAGLARDTASLSDLRLGLQRQRPNLSLAQMLLAKEQQRLVQSVSRLFVNRRHQLEHCSASLKLLDPNATLSRGYCIVRGADDKVVSDVGNLQPGESIQLRFARGNAKAEVTSTEPFVPSSP